MIKDSTLSKIVFWMFVVLFIFFSIVYFGSGIFHKEFNPDEAIQMVNLLNSNGFVDYFNRFSFGIWSKICSYAAYFLGANSIYELQASSTLLAVFTIFITFFISYFSTKNLILSVFSPVILFVSNYFELISGFATNAYMATLAVTSLITLLVMCGNISFNSVTKIFFVLILSFILGFLYPPFAIYISFICAAIWILGYLEERERFAGRFGIQRLRGYMFSRTSVVSVGIAIVSVASVGLYLLLDPHPEIASPRPDIHQFYFPRSEHAGSIGGFFSWSREVLTGTVYSMLRPLRFWASDTFSFAWSWALFMIMGLGVVMALRKRGAMAVIALAFCGNFAFFYLLASINVYAFGDIRYIVTLWPAALLLIGYGAGGFVQFVGQHLRKVPGPVYRGIGHISAITTLIAATMLIGRHAFAVYQIVYGFNQSFDNQIALINSSDVRMVIIDDRVDQMLAAQRFVEHPLFPMPRVTHVSSDQYRERLLLLERMIDDMVGQDVVRVGLLTYFDLENYPQIEGFLREINCEIETTSLVNRWNYRILLCQVDR